MALNATPVLKWLETGSVSYTVPAGKRVVFSLNCLRDPPTTAINLLINGVLIDVFYTPSTGNIPRTTRGPYTAKAGDVISCNSALVGSSFTLVGHEYPLDAAATPFSAKLTSSISYTVPAGKRAVFAVHMLQDPNTTAVSLRINGLDASYFKTVSTNNIPEPMRGPFTAKAGDVVTAWSAGTGDWLSINGHEFPA